MVWLIDLDGVVWLAGKAIDGSGDAVARLVEAGERVVFVTNNSGPTVSEYQHMLSEAGVPTGGTELVTSSQAAAAMLEPGSTAAVVGGAGIHEALGQRGIAVVPAGAGPQAVVVGRSVELDYDELSAAASAIRDGARFIATNTDATFPTPAGFLPGAGAIIAFLSVAAGRQPEVAGKPCPPAGELVRARYGNVDVVVGDRPDTDGGFARLVGARFTLVLSGVTEEKDLPVDPAPDEIAANLAAAVTARLGKP